MIGGEADRHLGTLGDGALEVIRGRVAKQIFLIGSLGTSKTYGAAHAMLSVAHNFPGSVLVVGRKNLTELKRGTLLSFYEVAGDMGLTDFTTTRSPAEWRFENGSLLMFVELDTPRTRSSPRS